MNRGEVELAILEVMRVKAALDPLVGELAIAQRHGNLDRIGNAAYDALTKADLLAASLSATFALAADRD